MRRKIIIVAVGVWLITLLGGGLWGRMEQYLHERSIPPGEIEVRNLKDLYGAKLFDEVLGECARGERDPKYADYQPQILYIRWAAQHQLDKSDDAMATQRQFLDRYPNHVLAADMHFSDAMNELASADYRDAKLQLKSICDRYPTAEVAKKAADILRRLRAAVPTTTEPVQ